MANQNLKIQITAIDRTRAAFRGIAVSLGKVRRALFSFQTAIVGAVGAAGLGLLVKSSLDSIDALGKTASKLGVTTSELQKLRFAAELAGVSTRTTDMAVQRFTRRLAEAAIDTGEAKDALKELGLNARELTKLPLEEQMLQLADAFDQVENSGDRVRLAFKLFDSEGVAFVNTLQDGRVALKEMFDEVDDLGFVLSQSAVKGVEDANDAFLRLGSVFRGLRDTVVAALAPAFTALADTVRDALVNKITGDFDSVQRFGEAMAISLITFLQNAASAFIEFANTVIRHVNNLRRVFHNLEAAFSDALSPDEYQQRIEEIIGHFERWRRHTEQSTTFFNGAFREMGAAMLPLAKGAELSAEELRAMADELLEIGERSNAVRGTQQLAAMLQALAVEAENGTKSFKEFGQITLNTNSFFENLIASIRSGSGAFNDLGAAAKGAGKDIEETFDFVLIKSEDVKKRGIQSLEDALVDVASKTKTVREAFADMARSIMRDLQRMAIRQAITIPLARSMGLNVEERAMGGPVTAGRPYLVGERGPELMVPGRSGTIVPNGQLGGGAVTVNQTINLTTGVSQTVRAEVLQMLPQIADAAKGAVLDAKRRGGSYAAALG